MWFKYIRIFFFTLPSKLKLLLVDLTQTLQDHLKYNLEFPKHISEAIKELKNGYIDASCRG